MIVSEETVFKMLNEANDILLVEPNYNRKYPPMGLGKISSYLKSTGKKVDYARSILPKRYDLICMTTLFTYYSEDVFKAIKERGLFNTKTPILIGGVMASIMPDQFDSFDNVSVFKGYSKVLDSFIPDPEIMNNIEDPWNTYAYSFTSRGCPNKCAYCAVWRIEPERWINPYWFSTIDMSKPNVMLFDNNLSSFPVDHLKELVQFLVRHNKKVLFDNGFDCKYITREVAGELSKLKFIHNGMRLAFDRIDDDGVFQGAVELCLKSGIPASQIMAYVLFNFDDRPQDAYYRAKTCTDLGIRPYPQYYRPLMILSKKDIFVGKHWTLNLGRAFRYYWLMRGIFSKMSFEEYIKSPEGVKNHHLTENDISMYMNNGVIK